MKGVNERFFNKIEKTEYCWNFKGKLRNGYGCLKVNGKLVQANRLSWNIHFGEIPPNIFVCHKCDNRKCVNPDHLFLGTQKDNMQDCLKKGRMVIPIGHKFKLGNYPNNTKISINTAREVKNAVLNKGNKKLIKIANEFNVPYQYVRDISCGRILKSF